MALRFLNRVVPADQLIAEAEAIAAELASKPTFSLRATKMHVNAVMEDIAGTRRNANDADTLAAALADEESTRLRPPVPEVQAPLTQGARS